jgi:hypothetical protein
MQIEWEVRFLKDQVNMLLICRLEFSRSNGDFETAPLEEQRRPKNARIAGSD